jgi:hypothetical protein
MSDQYQFHLEDPLKLAKKTPLSGGLLGYYMSFMAVSLVENQISRVRITGGPWCSAAIARKRILGSEC